MPSGQKILIGPSSFAEKDKRPLETLASAGFQVVDNPFKRKLAKAELLDLLQKYVVGLIAGLEPLDREVLTRSSLKVISRVGSGMSNVDQAAARELGIAVRSTPDGPTESVAELTLGMMLCVLRMVPQMDGPLHQGAWVKKTGSELAGKTVAIVGFGRIGRRLAELLTPFRTVTLVVDPFLSGPLPPGCQLVTLDDALGRADLISLHASGDACLVGPEQFAQMKPGVFLFNAARGGVVAEDELLKHLQTGKVAGAWLDAFSTEPYAGPLRDCPNVILTPHVGSYTAECRSGMEAEAVRNLLTVLGPH